MSNNRSARYTKKQEEPKKAGPLLIALAGFVLILLASLALVRPVSAVFSDLFGSGSPSLKVDKEKVDLGDVKLGKPVSVTFQITNTGNKTLHFSKAPYVQVLKGC